MLVAVGVALLVLGLLSGGALVAAPLGWLASQSNLTLWVTFPVLSLMGFTFVATQAQPSVIRSISVASSAAMLLLALASITVLVLSAAGLMPAPETSASLWFVMVVGALLGSMGAAAFSRGMPQA